MDQSSSALRILEKSKREKEFRGRSFKLDLIRGR